MNLFEKAIYFAKSVGYSVESEEHKLINEFISYLGSEKVISGFSDSPVIKQFAATIAPQPDSTPALVAPPTIIIPEETPAPVETPEPVETLAAG